MSLIQVPVSYGELIDKITILEIKSKQITDPAKLANVRTELDLLNTTWASHPASQTDITAERARLLGFPTVYSGVFVRSSFNAEEVFHHGQAAAPEARP